MPQRFQHLHDYAADLSARLRHSPLRENRSPESITEHYDPGFKHRQYLTSQNGRSYTRESTRMALDRKTGIMRLVDNATGVSVRELQAND